MSNRELSDVQLFDGFVRATALEMVHETGFFGVVAAYFRGLLRARGFTFTITEDPYRATALSPDGVRFVADIEEAE